MCLSVHVLHDRKSYSPWCFLSGQSVWYETYILWSTVRHSCEMLTPTGGVRVRVCDDAMWWGAARFLFNDVSYAITKTTLLCSAISMRKYHYTFAKITLLCQFLKFNKYRSRGGGRRQLFLWPILTGPGDGPLNPPPLSDPLLNPVKFPHTPLCSHCASMETGLIKSVLFLVQWF